MSASLRIFAFHGMLTKVGGAERAFANKLVSLRKRGHEITLWTLDISDHYRNWLKGSGVDVNTFAMKRSYMGGRQLTVTTIIRAMRRLNKLVPLSRSYDVAFLHHYDYSPLLAARLAPTGIPIVYYCPEPPRHYYEPDLQNVTTKKKMGKALGSVSNWIDKTIDRHGVEHVDKILTNSDYTREVVWRTYGKMPTTVYLGVDLERFRNLDMGKDNMVLAIGGNYYLKAHDFIVRSLGKVPRDIRPNLTIVGKGDRHSDFVRLAEENGVEVSFVENATDEQMIELYNRARATVVAYVMEPFGLVALESMACCTPVIAVREGGLRESVTPETGWLTDRNEEDFAQAVEQLVRRPDVGAQKGLKGRERVETYFTWDRFARDLERVLIHWSRAKRGPPGS
jgi:glycosyltransferase involved in cell wall biosynthesis